MVSETEPIDYDCAFCGNTFECKSGIPIPTRPTCPKCDSRNTSPSAYHPH